MIWGNKRVRTGKREPRHDPRTLRFGSYITGLPEYPRPLTRSQLVPLDEWGMMANDDYGDCTCAAAGHAEQITSATISNGATIHTPTDEQVLDAYWGTGDEDDGRYSLDVLNYWRKTGIGGSKAYAFVELDLDDFFHQFRHAIHLFGFVYLGLDLPQTAATQAEWRYVDGPGNKPGSWGGHAVIATDYRRRDLTSVSWGELIKIGWRFIEHYCDEAYAVILPDWLDASGHSVEGFDLAALNSDLAKLG